MDGESFSVVLTTYANDDPAHLRTALDSVVEQTVVPDEIIIVKDGPVPDRLAETIDEFADDYPTLVGVYALAENCGHGKALQVGVERCSNDLVAIMDADDIAVETRFEQQLEFLHQHPEIDLVGGHIEEFDDDPESPHAVREVPLKPDRVRKVARFRSPVNQTTAMFRRERVLSVGNYRAVDRMEDYDLWVRLLVDGATIANLDGVLVLVRAGVAMHERRGGVEYAREECRQQWSFLTMGFVSMPTFIRNILLRVSIRLLPNNVRGWIYARILRESDR